MKKSIQFLFAIFLTCQLANAQSIKLGVKAGANYSNLNSDFNESGLTSYHFGAVLEFKTPIIGIQPELIYSSQGAKVKGLNDVKLDYIAVPIVLKFYITKLSLEVGPQFSYLVNENLSSQTVTDINKTDIGVLGGVGLKLVGGLFTQARYVVGVTDNLNTGGGKNNVFQLSMGYNF